MAIDDSRYRPIIFVRGYAGNDDEIADTVADPYMGFNIGSTKFRQHWTGDVRRYYFESPLYRLAKDYKYTDVYSHGQFMPADLDIPPRCVVVYRYYDHQFLDAVEHDGVEPSEIDGKQASIEEFADGLSKLILRLRQRIASKDEKAAADFRVYLVAHSMGGLICRAFLQNPKVGSPEAKKVVDKVFTYATPHNGIDASVIGNVPNFFSLNNANNFSRPVMRQYLGLPDGTEDVSTLNGQFDPNRFFCLVGTNWRDYTVAGGWARRLIGPLSDGLVRIANASVSDGDGDKKIEAPRAFVHRSHSGYFGIVNSEEGYQNLTRFLFGDVRVDGTLEIEQLTLPREVEDAHQKGQTIHASYQFEVVVRVRGTDWDLHRRTTEEQSAIFRTFDEMFPSDKDGKPRSPTLFSVFLSMGERVNSRRPSLGFAIDLRVLVPDYEVGGIRWLAQKYNGSYLYRDTITVEATPPKDDRPIEEYKVRYGFDSNTPNRATRDAKLEVADGAVVCTIPVASDTQPGMEGRLVLKCMNWE